MRVFISDLHTTFGQSVARLLQDAEHDVVGSVPSKQLIASSKRRLQEHPNSDSSTSVKDPVCVVTDKVALSKLVSTADVVLTSIVRDTKRAIDLLKLYEQTAEVSTKEDEAAASQTKRFIAISSVLTWTRNTPFANGDTQRGHSEDDYKTRKPARKYAEIKTAETQILSANRAGTFETCLIASGLVYGGANSDLARLFRDAWMYPDQPLVVPCLPGGPVARGGNLVPMISVYDLALLASKLCDPNTAVPKSYMIAVDQTSATTTLHDICVGLSVVLGQRGQVRDTLTDQEIDDLLTSDEVDDGHSGSVAALQVHLAFDVANETSALLQLVPPSAGGEDAPPSEWKHLDKGGLMGNLAFYGQDFIACMDLRPLRVVMLGPPCVGKTTLAQQVAKDYYLPHVTVESVMKELIASGVEAQQPREEVKGDGQEQLDPNPKADDEEEEVKSLRALVQHVASAAELPEATIVALLRWKLTTATCQNQGYVLDGIPVSVAQATKTFEPIVYPETDEGEGNEAAADEKAQPSATTDAKGEDPTGEDGSESESAESKALSLAASRSRAIMEKLRPRKSIHAPNRAVLLTAPRELLESRAHQLTEKEAVATGNTEVAFEARWKTFSTEAEGLATFFETAPLSVEVLELNLDNEADYRDADKLRAPVSAYLNQGTGAKPHNFHPTREEIQQQERAFAQKQAQDAARAQELEREQDERDAADSQARMLADRARLEVIYRDEAELLETRAKPLRTYLMDTVLPALTEGMLEVIKVQPEDPIDYLAEFLFQKGREMEEADQ